VSVEEGAVEAIEDLTRRVYESTPVELPGAYPVAVAARVMRNDERIQTLDLEHLEAQPREHHGNAVLHDGPSFAAYVNRLADERTTMWARQVPGGSTKPSITAIFNDHRDSGQAGWRDHTATLDIDYDPDWKDWREADGKEMPQKDFAQFLLDHAHTLGQQDIGKLMLAVTKFRASRDTKYSSAVNLTNGEVTFTFEEQIKNDTKGAQTVTLPEKITIESFVFAGATEATQATVVEAFLRYEVPRDPGPLRIGYKLIRPDKAEREAWDVVCAQIDEATPDEVPLLQGTAPAALRTRGATSY
jgi:uncharacterized protein YfdQ (DUF2303 family)